MKGCLNPADNDLDVAVDPVPEQFSLTDRWSDCSPRLTPGSSWRLGSGEILSLPTGTSSD